MKFVGVVLAIALVLCSAQADAGRVGGGGSVGKQSGNVSRTVPAGPASPAQPAPGNPNAASQSAANHPAAAPAAFAAPRPAWGSMLGGVAAGLGLAWMAHSLGLGEGFGVVLLLALVALGMVLLWRVFRRSRAPLPNSHSPFAFAGGGMAAVPAQRSYRPENVGNDASARPFEQHGFTPLSAPQTWGIPEGFDTQGFLTAAKTQFVHLQQAWDSADMASLRAMMTDAMLGEIKTQLAERETHATMVVNRTEVVMLEARMLGIEELPQEYMASVEFSGMIREDPSAGPSPFREVWNMTKSRTQGGWLVAGVQALQ